MGMSCSVCVLVSISLCRLAYIPTAQRVHIGESALPTYSVVAVSAFLSSVVLVTAGVRYFSQTTISWTLVHVGTLLLLDGVSFFTQSVYDSDPFSLVDDLARIIAEAQGGTCALDDPQPGSKIVRRCDCAKLCRTEIIGWFVITWALIGLGGYHHYLRYSSDKALENVVNAFMKAVTPRSKREKAGATEEETAGLTDETPCESDPPK